MYNLRLLGGIGLRDDGGRDVDALLRQPKHIALLAFIALPRPGVWHRRDSLLGTFWPDHEQTRARSALRSALYTIRRHLPEGTVASRGDDELSVSAESLNTDVSAMSDDLAAGRYKAALDRYQGELLPGLYIADAPAFEKWLEGERNRTRAMARKAAAAISEQLEQAGDLTGAIEAARRAAELDPDDEAAARRWIALLDRAGDRAQAFAVYEKFRDHMAEAFGVRPSAETVALLDAVRTRREPSLQPSNDKVSTISIAPSAPSLPEPTESRRKSRRRLWWAAVPIGLAALAWVALRPHAKASTSNSSRSLIVLPMENETGDPKLAYIATGIADDVANRLKGLGGFSIKSGARSQWTEKTRHDLQEIGREMGATILLRTSIRKFADSLELHASVVDANTSEETSLKTRRFSTLALRDVESSLTADVAGAVFRVALPAVPRKADHPVDPESYRLMLEGFQLLLSNIQTSGPNAPTRPGAQAELSRTGKAGYFFQQAVNIDPSNARAWSGLSSVWSAQAMSDQIPFDEGFDRASAAALRALELDSLQGTAWANLAIMRALKYNDLSVGMQMIAKAERDEPSNPEVFMVKSAMLRSAHLYDQARDAIRVARQLDPLTPYYLDREAIVEFCAGRPEAALRLYRSELNMNSGDKLAQAGFTRSLAMLGRYDEALASFRKQAFLFGDTALAARIAVAKGRDGYWKIKHDQGSARLVSITSSPERVSLLSLMQASFASGDSAAGFQALDLARRDQTHALYRLSCMPDIDEFRDTPRFRSTVASIGALGAR